MGLDIASYFEGKTILITGATGFLAKVFIEKILRIQPNVKKLFLIIRAADASSAVTRVHEEIVQKSLFGTLREREGSNIMAKMVAVAGDISYEHLGISDSQLRNEMLREIDIIVNSAATTRFVERYDVALATNTFGAANVMSFAKMCPNLKMFLHVSTAYICGEREGLVLEKPFRMAETLNGSHNLDINTEQQLARELLTKLQIKNASDMEMDTALKDLGLQRARTHGWPNTYAFTKAMGEMLLGHLKRERLPLLIFRPTIITSTLKEPFPGWVENLRTVDSIAFAYGKGKLKFFLADHHAVLDMIPVDMVVNAMVVGAVMNSHHNLHCPHGPDEEPIIHHISSSLRNRVTFGSVRVIIRQYFLKFPWVNKDGKPLKVGKGRVISSMSTFYIYMSLRYLIFVKGLRLVSSMPYFQKYSGLYLDMDQKTKVTMRLVELYKPYVFFKGIFDDSNTEALRRDAKESGVDLDSFNFDPQSIISWEDYLTNIHFPGARLAISLKK